MLLLFMDFCNTSNDFRLHVVSLIILMKLFIKSKFDLIWTVSFRKNVRYSDFISDFFLFDFHLDSNKLSKIGHDFSKQSFKKNKAVFGSHWKSKWQVLSVESILFWWKFKKIQIVAWNFNFLPNKQNFCCGSYWKAESIHGGTVIF